MMKESKYAEKCEVCGKHTKRFDTSTGKIVCETCMNKNGGKKELEEPVQADIYDYLFGNGKCKEKLGMELKESDGK